MLANVIKSPKTHLMGHQKILWKQFRTAICYNVIDLHVYMWRAMFYAAVHEHCRTDKKWQVIIIGGVVTIQGFSAVLSMYNC